MKGICLIPIALLCLCHNGLGYGNNRVVKPPRGIPKCVLARCPFTSRFSRAAPETFKCPGESGYYPHPESCELYYGCWNFEPKLYECPGKQLFDLRYRGCNWPELTQCQNRTRPSGLPAPPPVEPNPDFKCPGEQGYYPHPEKCEKYYGCLDFQPTMYTCTGRQLFDMKYRGCNWPELTQCQNRTRPQGYPSPPESSEGTGSDSGSNPAKPYNCPVDMADGFYADSANCAAYYRCVYGTSYHYTCPNSLVYNEVARACDYKSNVKCGNRPIH